LRSAAATSRTGQLDRRLRSWITVAGFPHRQVSTHVSTVVEGDFEATNK
jgi:hypothetical protein